MGILDDAIREHLDLKRKHGARDSELRELEDDALGAGEQPDPFSSSSGEIFNEVATKDAPVGEEPTRLVEPGGTEPPPSEPPPSEPSEMEAPGLDRGEPEEEISPPEGLRETPGQERFEEPIPGQERLPEPEPFEERRAPQPEPPSEELEAPEPSQSLEELIEEEEPFPEDAAAPEAARPEAHPPPETAERPEADYEPPESGAPLEPPAGEEIKEPDREPEGSVPDPPPPPPPGSEPPGRARGRVDVPTQEHPPPGETGGLPPLPPESEPEALAPREETPPLEEELGDEEPQAGGPQLYDFETDEDPIPPPTPVGDTDDDFEALGPVEEEAPYIEDEEPNAEEPAGSTEPPVEEEAYEGRSLDPEETYEDEGEDDLWFEKGPPKDFDFEDDDR